jgi:hypothetical protein
MLLVLSFYLMFDVAVSPVRGVVARSTDRIVTYSSLFLEVALLILVVDSSYLCYRFVDYLDTSDRKTPQVAVDSITQWSEDAQREACSDQIGSARVGFEVRAQIMKGPASLLRVKLIANATDVVAHMIYYPFIVLLLLLLAQNRFFDDVQIDIPLSLTVGLSAVTAVYCAYRLQHVSTKAKDRAVEVVKGLSRGVGTGTLNKTLASKLDQIRSEIEETESRAFLPLYSHPIIKALLIPLGGAGGLALLQSFFGAG